MRCCNPRSSAHRSLSAAGVAALAIALTGCPGIAAAFLATFEIRNDSGEPVWVTPIGMTEGSGRFGPLPRYNRQEGSTRSNPNRTRLLLKPGESVAVTYDTDDINFRHILVRPARGPLRILDTDHMGTLGACYGPQKALYAIPSLRTLLPAPIDLEACETGSYVPYPPLRIEYFPQRIPSTTSPLPHAT